MSQEDKRLDLIGVAVRVYEALEEGGYYGGYVLGEDLWAEFSEKCQALLDVTDIVEQENREE